jgi:hypothetical protein
LPIDHAAGEGAKIFGKLLHIPYSFEKPDAKIPLIKKGENAKQEHSYDTTIN